MLTIYHTFTLQNVLGSRIQGRLYHPVSIALTDTPTYIISFTIMINDIHDHVSLMGYIHLYNLHLNLISLECYFSDVGKNSPAYYQSSLTASNISHDNVQYIEMM